MAEVDAAIPLQAQGPQPITLNSIAQLYQMQQQIKMQKQQQQVQNALSQIYSNPANLGPDGLPNAQAMMQIARVSPQAAQQMTAQKATVDEKQALTSQHQQDAAMAFQKNVQETVREPALNAYDEALKQGKTPQQALSIGQKAYSDGLDSLMQSGYVPDAMKSTLSQNFDPNGVRASAISYKDRLAAEQKQSNGADTNAYRSAEIGLGQQRAGLEGAHLAIDQANLGMRRAEFAQNQAQLDSANNGPKQTGANEGLPDKPIAGYSPEAIDEMAHRMLAGLPVQFPYGKAGGAAIHAAVENRAAALFQQSQGGIAGAGDTVRQGKADTAGTTSTVRGFDTGPQGNATRSLDVSIAHLDTLGHLSDALHNGNSQAINHFANEIAKQTGNPAPTNFNAAKQIVGDEIVKGIVGAGGSAGDREKAQEAISSANSPEQLAGVISTYQTLLGGQLKGLAQQYQSGTGRNDFGKKLTDETKKVLNWQDPSASSSGGKTFTYDPATGTFK